MGGRKVEHTLGTPVDQDNASAKQYAADGSNDSQISQPAGSSVEGDKGIATATSDEDGQAPASTYQTANQGNLGGRTVEHTEGTPIPEGNATGTKYRLLEDRLLRAEKATAELQLKYRKEQEARVETERFASLQSKRQRFAFDLDKEVERCHYSKMGNDAFAQHLDSIEANYRPIPLGEQLPVGFADEAASHAPHAPGNSREKYSKEQRKKALAWCSGRAQNGLAQDYETALNSFGEDNRPPTDAELASVG